MVNEFQECLGFEFSLDEVYAYFPNLLELLTSSKVRIGLDDPPNKHLGY
jgi:hypothetical protein